MASVGKTLGIEIGVWLADDLKAIPIELADVVAGLVQTACLAHDIGNPPFGHSGEEAIAAWFRDRLSAPSGALADLTADQRPEFEAFEGNAQGFRILTRTEMYRRQKAGCVWRSDRWGPSPNIRCRRAQGAASAKRAMSGDGATSGSRNTASSRTMSRPSPGSPRSWG